MKRPAAQLVRGGPRVLPPRKLTVSLADFSPVVIDSDELRFGGDMVPGRRATNGNLHGLVGKPRAQ